MKYNDLLRRSERNRIQIDRMQMVIEEEISYELDGNGGGGKGM